MVFHPTIHTPSLERSAEFFDRVFGRATEFLEVMPKSDTPRPADAPKGYSEFTLVQEVLIDCVNPSLHLTNGAQHFPSVTEPALFNIGWWCDDLDATFQTLKANDIPLVSQFGHPVGDKPPMSDQGGNIPQFFTPPDEMGVRYQFMGWFQLHIDPRTTSGWTLPPVADDDPLGIERLAHHVILTKDPDRVLRMMVHALGGKVIHEGRDELLGISGPYVHLADAVFHYGVPDENSPAAAALAGRLPADRYHSLTWKVVDLDRVERHLTSVGVKIAARTDDALLTDATTSFNIPWGFTTKLSPGDPRGAA
jgi:catechol 2,3-dioxygenase-like lactoylglutathione lyase family enzyme